MASLLADLNSVTALTPTAATNTLANAAAGPINDVPGNLQICQSKAKELKQLLTTVTAAVDGSDPIKTLITALLVTIG